MPKKHLGQNFLKSKKAIHQMIQASNLGEKDVVVEVGPGKGVLTEALLEKAQHVIAYEKDYDLIPLLQEKFAHNTNFSLIQGDILKFSPKDIERYGEEYKVIANIPYYITGAIIEMFLTLDFQPTSMTLLVQKEVAERVVARPARGRAGMDKESILSLSVKAYGKPRLVAKVPKQYFSPAPKVDSAILHIDAISKDFFNGFDEKKFFSVVKKSFQFKRKNIFNNLKDSFSNTTFVLEELGIDKKTRAEDLPLETFSLLAQKLK